MGKDTPPSPTSDSSSEGITRTSSGVVKAKARNLGVDYVISFQFSTTGTSWYLESLKEPGTILSQFLADKLCSPHPSPPVQSKKGRKCNSKSLSMLWTVWACGLRFGMAEITQFWSLLGSRAKGSLWLKSIGLGSCCLIYCL